MDDHPLFHEAVGRLMGECREFEIVPEADDGEEAYLDAAMSFYNEKVADDPIYKEILDSHWAFKALCDRAGIK